MAVSAAAGGGGGGGFGQPGRSTQTQHNALAFLQDSSGNVLVNASASAGILTFKAKGSAGPPSSTPGTSVTVSVGGQNQGAFACWMVPDSMFTVSSDLSANLHFRSDAPGVTLCPGFAIASGLPTSGLVPLDGFGGGQSTGFIGAVALDLSWPTTSQLFDSHSTSQSTCGPFRANSQLTFDDNLGTSASGSISATLQSFDISGNPVPLPINATLTSQFADVSASHSANVVQGPTTGTCGPFGS
jgi:hypothetical protein